MAKKVEYFIAQRTARSDSKGGEGGAMIRIASLSIALSLGVMILTLAIIAGFKREVHSQLTALSGDIIVATTKGPNPAEQEPIESTPAIWNIAQESAQQFDSEVLYIAPYATRSAIIRTSEGVEGVVLKGVDSTFRSEPFARGFIEGGLPQFGGENPTRNTIISSVLASELGLKVGAKIELLILGDKGEARRDLYRVGAIYTANSGDIEKPLIITDIANVRRINGWSDKMISGYDITITNRKNAIEIAEVMNREIIFSSERAFANTAAFATQRLYPSIFDWLSALDINAVVIISIMMVVAIFNIITAMLILVLERIDMIGVLKSIGMNNNDIRKIFLYRALNITFRGLIWGNAVATILALVQQKFHFVKLDQSGYLLNSVPIELEAWWILALNAGVIFTIFVVVIAPTRLVSSIEPCKAIKFQ